MHACACLYLCLNGCLYASIYLRLSAWGWTFVCLHQYLCSLKSLCVCVGFVFCFCFMSICSSETFLFMCVCVFVCMCINTHVRVFLCFLLCFSLCLCVLTSAWLFFSLLNCLFCLCFCGFFHDFYALFLRKSMNMSFFVCLSPWAHI